MSYSIKKTRSRLPLYYLAFPFAFSVAWYLLPACVMLGHLACGLSCLITTRSPRYAGLLLQSSLYVYWQEASATHLQVALLVSVAEEMIFRYAMLGWLSLTVGPGWALAMVSVLFAAMHLRPAAGRRPGAGTNGLFPMLDYLLFGLLLGGLTLGTGSLYPAVVVHAMRNYILRCLLITKEEYAERND